MTLYLQPLKGSTSIFFRQYFLALYFYDLVAQLAEHLPFKERVLGSSPSQVTYQDTD